MTPHAATARILAAHGPVVPRPPLVGPIIARCQGCRWVSEDARYARQTSVELHAAHVADVLAAAGVLPTVREWGVYLRDGAPPVSELNREAAERRVALARRRIYPEAHVVTRLTGATAWTAEEETE